LVRGVRDVRIEALATAPAPADAMPYSARMFTPRPFRLRLGLCPALTLLLALLLAAPASAQSTAASLGLIGDVAAVREFHETPGDSERQLRTEIRFAPDGAVVEDVTTTYALSDGSLRRRVVTSYDAAGYRQEQVTLGPDGALLGRTAYGYDAGGHEVERVSYDADGNETLRTDTERDAAGRVLRALLYRAGVLERSTERRYDAEGRLLEERTLEADGVPLQEHVYTEPGRAYDFVTYFEGEIDERGQVVLDAEGRFLSVASYDADGELAYVIEWTRDDTGRELERRDVTDGRESRTISAYTFDAVGNWVRIEVSEDDGAGSEIFEVRDREIDYR
jgi:hypothetical protein